MPNCSNRFLESAVAVLRCVDVVLASVHLSGPAIMRRRFRQSMAQRHIVAASLVAVDSSGTLEHALADTMDWGVSQSGAPGIYSWQQLYNWNAAGQHLTPAGVPHAGGGAANLHLLSGNQIINVEGWVSIGTMNIGDFGRRWSYVVAVEPAGRCGSTGGAPSALNKCGTGSDALTANTTLAGAAPFTADVDEGILAFSCVVSGVGGMTRNGDGMLILNVANTYTGITMLSGAITLLAASGNNTNILGLNSAGNPTIVNSGATLAYGPDVFGSGQCVPAEPITINVDGFRNNGTIRGLMGANGTNINGVVTMGGAARIQNDLAGMFTLYRALNVSNMLDCARQEGGK